MRPFSLKWRVALPVTGLILLVVSGFGFAAYREMKESLTHYLDQTLLPMSSAVRSILESAASRTEAEREIKAIVETPLRRERICFRIWNETDRTDTLKGSVGSSGAESAVDDAVLAGVRPPAPGNPTFFDTGKGRDPYRGVWMRAQVAGRDMNIAIALSSSPLYHELAEYRRMILVVGLAVIVAAFALTTLLVEWGLRPISRTAGQLTTVTGRNVGETQLPSGGAPSELRPFVRAVSDMLQRLASAMTEQKRFIADASHELRTPLSIARSTADAALVKDRGAAEYRQALRDVREDLDRMSKLVEDLLVLARLDEAAPYRPPERFDLSALLGELARRYGPRISASGGRLALNLRPAHVCADRAQLERLFANLLDNALQHGPPGGAIGLSVETPDERTVAICVYDEGGTIAPEALPHLFGRFYRTDPSRSHSSGGSGLGLSIAREIARRHRGDITVTSSRPDGTCLRVTLPLA